MEDLAGKIFGRLTVVCQEGKQRGQATWKCLCECGSEKVATSSNLRTGNTKSCGCLRRELARLKVLDLTGKRFGMLTVLSREPNKGERTQWKSLCDCGNTTVCDSWNLVSNHTTSCGCYLNDIRGKCLTTHGMSRTATYFIWAGILARCLNKNTPNYHNYGGRGITICEAWKDFEAFYADMGERPDGLSLDRIDNDGPYTASNCRWATAHDQSRNKRTNVWHTIEGRDMIATDFAEELAVSRLAIRNWKKEGLTDEQMIARAAAL